MPKVKAFDNITEENIKSMLNCFKANTLTYKKDATILSNVANTTNVGIIKSGSAEIVRYNYNGSRTIIEILEEGDVFGAFSSSNTEDLYVISTSDTVVVMFDYSHLINRCKKNCPYHNQLIDNMMHVLSAKLKHNSERIEVLTKKTIREKLLSYFNTLSLKQISKNITIPFTLTDLADYLSIDRSAMMREIKNLNEEGLISSKGKKIHLYY